MITKVAVIGKGNVLYWDSHVADAFRLNECEVIHERINERSLPIQIKRTLLKVFSEKDKAQQKTDQLHAEAMGRRLKAFEPDLIFFVSAFFIPLPYYEMARSLPGRPLVCAWDGDCAADLSASLPHAPFIDALFIANADCVERNKGRFNRVSLLQFAVNPHVFSDEKAPREAKLYFCGARTAEREKALSKVTSAPLVIRGPNWRNFRAVRDNCEIMTEKVNLASLAMDYNSYSFFFNMIQTENGTGGLNMRSYEVPACGGLLVCEYDKEMEYTLEPGKELLTFVDPNEINDLLERCLKDEVHAQTIAKQGQRRVLAEHTYENRMKEVLSLLA